MDLNSNQEKDKKEKHSFFKTKFEGARKTAERYACRFQTKIRNMRKEDEMTEYYLLIGEEPYPHKTGVLYESPTKEKMDPLNEKRIIHIQNYVKNN